MRKKIGMLKAIHLCKQFTKAVPVKRKEIQDKRLHELVAYARANSPYYKKLYESVPKDFELSDLPCVNKLELMAHYNEWTTDSSVKLEDIQDFMKNLDNIGRKFKGKYLVFTTSGSTGNPLVSLCDYNTNQVMNAINILRTFSRKEDMSAFIKDGGRSIGVFANEGFYLGNSSVRARLLSMPWKKKQIAVTSALLPTDKIVEQLNTFQPSMLGGYPSNLELLIDEQRSGRLHIRPVLIMTGGEYLSDKLREDLADAFHCYVQTSYSCTEGGTMACECTEHHFHINDDWILLEPVDKDNQLVSDGIQSDKVLITNLSNYSLPFIRYEVTDRVVMHHSPCACGNPSPWITLEGRTDDVVTLIQDGKEIRIAPLAIYAMLKELHVLRRFQLLVGKNNNLELRLEPVDSVSRKDAFATAEKEIRSFLSIHGISEVTISLSEELPKQNAGSGKFKHIIQLSH